MMEKHLVKDGRQESAFLKMVIPFNKRYFTGYVLGNKTGLLAEENPEDLAEKISILIKRKSE